MKRSCVCLLCLLLWISFLGGLSAQEFENPLQELIFIEADRQFEEMRRQEDREAEERLKMPDVRGVSQERAVGLIQSIDTRARPIIRTIPSEGAPDLVVSQRPLPGQPLEDVDISLYVSRKLENSRLSGRVSSEKPKSAESHFEVSSFLQGVLFFAVQVVILLGWLVWSRRVEQILEREKPNELALFNGDRPPKQELESP